MSKTRSIACIWGFNFLKDLAKEVETTLLPLVAPLLIGLLAADVAGALELGNEPTALAQILTNQLLIAFKLSEYRISKNKNMCFVIINKTDYCVTVMLQLLAASN